MKQGQLRGSRQAQRLVLVVAVVSGLALLALIGPDHYSGGVGATGSLDFVAYWSGARLALEGENPYDPEALLAIERAAGWARDEALMMWNPPWAAAMVLPFALLPFPTATFAWLVVLTGLILMSGVGLWAYFEPETDRHWVGLLLAVGFAPGLFALHLGQISPFLLAGVVGFLWAVRKERDVAAGAALALLTIKPHITSLFLLAVLWWVLKSRRWRVLVGSVIAVGGATGIVLLIQPHIFSQYMAVTANPPLQYATPTVGFWLMIFFGIERRWLQFVPFVIATLGLVLWLRRRDSWRWEDVAAPVLLTSVIAAPFGWNFDQVVLLLAVAAVVSGLRRSTQVHRATALAFVIASQVVLLVMRWHAVLDYLYVWHPLALAGLYWFVARADADEPERATLRMEQKRRADTSTATKRAGPTAKSNRAARGM